MSRVLFIVLCCLTLPSNAASRGIQWGVGLTSFSAELTDPDGATGTSDLSLSFNVASIVDSGRDNRWLSVINFGSYDLDPTTSEIGQSNDFYYIGSVYQTNFRWSRNIKPWFGIGLGLGYESFSSRHTVDIDGFLSQSFKDRDEFGALLMLDASHDFQIAKQDFIVRASYLSSLYDGSDLTELSVFWFFN